MVPQDNTNHREMIEVLKELRDAYYDEPFSTEAAALQYFIGVGERMEQKKLEKVIFNIIRYDCAAEKCEKTCPAYNDNNNCGIWTMAKKSTQAILTFLKEEER